MRRIHSTLPVLALVTVAAVLPALPGHAQPPGLAVVNTLPADGATDVPLQSTVIIKFSSPVDPSSLTAHSVRVNGHPLDQVPGGAISVADTDAAVVSFRMKPDAVYRLSVGTGVKDARGGALAKPFTWRYATRSGMGGPGTPMKVFARYPRLNDRRVPINAPITMSFTSDIDAASLAGAAVRVQPSSGGSPVPGKLTVQGRRAMFRPDSPLEPNQTYEVQVVSGVKGKSGVASERASTWQFTTGDSASEGPAITDSWYESYASADGLSLVFHMAAENLAKPGQGAANSPGLVAGCALKAAVVSLSGLEPAQPLSTPTAASAADLPVTNGAPATVVTAAYTHGGGHGAGNSVAGNSTKDPALEPVAVAVEAALAADQAVMLKDSGDIIEDGDQAGGDGVYSGRLSLGNDFPIGQALIAFTIIAPDGKRAEPVKLALYVLPPEAVAAPAAAGK